MGAAALATAALVAAVPWLPSGWMLTTGGKARKKAAVTASNAAACCAVAAWMALLFAGSALGACSPKLRRMTTPR